MPSYTSAADPAEAVDTWLGQLTPETQSGFVHMQCADGNPFLVKSCWYSDAWYSVLESIPSAAQFMYKYLPDIDGHSYSGRFLGFLRSQSLPIKATIYSQWHDARLVPWTHFVPMDNSFVDLYGILEYFVGYNATRIEGRAVEESRNRPAHDAQAEQIATAGARWAQQVLRREDRLAYLYRLILELARISDDKRLRMGWVEDLKNRSSDVI